MAMKNVYGGTTLLIWCTIKIFMGGGGGAGVVDEVKVNNERCLKWVGE